MKLEKLRSVSFPQILGVRHHFTVEYNFLFLDNLKDPDPFISPGSLDDGSSCYILLGSTTAMGGRKALEEE